jgi:hypothetical protein
LRNGSPDAPDVPRPLLSIAEFFEGNSAVGSIGCNLPNATPSQFYEALAAIAARPDVKDIRVRITDFDVPSWPFADTVFIMTTAQPQDVAAWFPKEIAPDEAWEGFHQGET